MLSFASNRQPKQTKKSDLRNHYNSPRIVGNRRPRAEQPLEQRRAERMMTIRVPSKARPLAESTAARRAFNAGRSDSLANRPRGLNGPRAII